LNINANFRVTWCDFKNYFCMRQKETEREDRRRENERERKRDKGE
jgi:hypothetical protein